MTHPAKLGSRRLIGLVFPAQPIDQFVHVAGDDLRQGVQGQAFDAVVGNAPLREIVGADALAAVAAANSEPRIRETPM